MRSTAYTAVRANRLAFDRRTDKRLPINFSWVVPNVIAGCGLPTSSEQIQSLAAQNISLLVSCIELENAPPLDLYPEAVRSLHLEWRNYGTPTFKQMDEWIAEAQAELDRGRAIACHCFAGKGRTGTAIASFLIKHLQTPPVDAIEQVRSLRPGSIETRAQEEFLFQYHNRLYPDRAFEFDPSLLSKPARLA